MQLYELSEQHCAESKVWTASRKKLAYKGTNLYDIPIRVWRNNVGGIISAPAHGQKTGVKGT